MDKRPPEIPLPNIRAGHTVRLDQLRGELQTLAAGAAPPAHPEKLACCREFYEAKPAGNPGPTLPE
eukprot:9706037-Lingulodinium_polyedra.AAC.1